MGGTLGVAGSSNTRTSLISSHELKTFKRKKRRATDLFDMMAKPCWSAPLPEIHITEPPWGEDEAYDDAFTGQNQAWVTLVTNDTYALGALVLGASLRKAGTSRQLAVLITSTVSPTMKALLQSSFDLVQEVDPFDSNDAAHLAVLKRPELGITFTKIHCWTLTQYTKCVFLDADTLILSNCDELFQRPELSAVPDVGWPDCFNSGVFVFVPSVKTFEELVTLADREGSYDGGDQGLLNSYFSDWATKDIARHLSFIYNMNSNAFYSYLPAFLKFGHNVKIVHFIGARKPWHYTYNLFSNQVECGECRHYQEHLQLWWTIFLSHVQPRLTTDCAGLAGEMSKLSIKSAEELRSFPADQILGSEGRQFAWERGQIDYMGADAFANIQKKLDAAISSSPAAQPSDVIAAPSTISPVPEQIQTVVAAPVIVSATGTATVTTPVTSALPTPLAATTTAPAPVAGSDPAAAPVVSAPAPATAPAPAVSTPATAPAVSTPATAPSPAVSTPATEAAPALSAPATADASALPAPATQAAPVVPAPATQAAPVVPAQTTAAAPVVPAPAATAAPAAPAPATQAAPVVPAPATAAAPAVPAPATQAAPVVPAQTTAAAPVVPAPAAAGAPAVPTPATAATPVVPAPASATAPTVPVTSTAAAPAQAPAKDQ